MADGQVWGVSGRGKANALKSNKKGPAELECWPFSNNVLDANVDFTLRPTVLYPFLRRAPRFPGLTARTGSASGHPEALGACYVASWHQDVLDGGQLTRFGSKLP